MSKWIGLSGGAAAIAAVALAVAGGGAAGAQDAPHLPRNGAGG
jgi:hypothetical protein